MTDHTPTPYAWHADGAPIDPRTFESPGYFGNPELIAADGTVVLTGGGEYQPYNRPEDAAFIVRACNAHADMLAALRVCRDAERERRAKLLPGAPATTYTESRMAMIDAAIDRAEGRTL